MKTESSISYNKDIILNLSSIITELYIIQTDTNRIILKERFTNDNSTTTIASDAIPFLSFIKHQSNNKEKSPISFDSFYCKEAFIQLLIISQAKLSIIGIFKSNINTFFSKTLLLHIIIAYINFNNQNEERLLLLYQTIFAKFFCLPLISNFAAIINKIMKKQELNLSNIKYRTFYLIDLSSNSVLFNLNSFHNKKNVNLENNEVIWKEILYHSHNLMMKYKSIHKKKYNAFYSSDYWVNFECKSTFPRLRCIIKFLPVLHGISLVHIYHQKKLSHITEGNECGSKQYKECEVVYGTEQKKFDKSIDTEYAEPLKIQRIEQFFVNYFMTTSSAVSFYYAEKYEIKYYDSMIIRQINQIVRSNQGKNVGNLIKKIKEELNKESKQSHDINEMNSNFYNKENKGNKGEELDVINFIDFLYFSKEQYLKYYYIPEENINYSNTNKEVNKIQNENFTDVSKNIIDISKMNNANDASLTINNCKIDELGQSEIKSNLFKTKSIFQLDITGIQKVNDEVTEDNISNFYPTQAKDEHCISSRKNILFTEKKELRESIFNVIKNRKANWNASNIPHDEELSFRQSPQV